MNRFFTRLLLVFGLAASGLQAVPCFEKEINQAKQELQDKDIFVQLGSFSRFVKLVEDGHCIPEVIAAAKLGMQDAHCLVRYSSLMLLWVVTEKGHGIDEAMAAAKQMMQDKSFNIREVAKHICRDLEPRLSSEQQAKFVVVTSKL